jgi:hypothetical protein
MFNCLGNSSIQFWSWTQKSVNMARLSSGRIAIISAALAAAGAGTAYWIKEKRSENDRKQEPTHRGPSGHSNRVTEAAAGMRPKPRVINEKPRKSSQQNSQDKNDAKQAPESVGRHPIIVWPDSHTKKSFSRRASRSKRAKDNLVVLLTLLKILKKCL